MINKFNLKIYNGSSTKGKPVFTAAGNGDYWKSYITINLPGFDGTIVLSLAEFWDKVLKVNLNQYQESIYGFETIIKFGDTMQLKELFIVVVEVDY